MGAVTIAAAPVAAAGTGGGAAEVDAGNVEVVGDVVEVAYGTVDRAVVIAAGTVEVGEHYVVCYVNFEAE